MTTLHINALLYGLMLCLLTVAMLGILFWPVLPAQSQTPFEMMIQDGDLDAVETVVLAGVFSPVYALSQVVKRFAGINGGGKQPKSEGGVPHD